MVTRKQSRTSLKDTRSSGHALILWLASVEVEALSPSSVSLHKLSSAADYLLGLTSRVRMASQLLQLPREIRDLIYEHALVREVVPIECAVVPIPGATGSCNLGCYEDVIESLPLRRLRIRRRIWSIPTFDIDVSFSEGDAGESQKAVHMTYQLAIPHEKSPGHSIEIRLLQTCKQIYYEARKCFYGRNTFSFTADFRIPTAFAFLCDRPAESLLLISSMELALTEYNNTSATTEAHYPISRRSTDSLVLQYAYNHFTDLCILLSTSRMRLRNLHLTIESLAERRGIPPRTVTDCLSWEALKTTESRPWVASWIDPLLRLKGLDSLEMVWIFDRPRLRRMADTVSLMRQHMLRETPSGPGNRTDLSDGHKFDFRMLLPRRNEKTPRGYIAAERFIWGSCSLTGDESQPFNWAPDTVGDQEPTIWRQHIQDIIRPAGRLYVCICKLHKDSSRGITSG
jgi:hypothetical protein